MTNDEVTLVAATISAVFGGVLVKVADLAISRVRSRNKMDEKNGSVHAKLTLDDRAELRRSIDALYLRLDKTEARLDAALARIDTLQAENANLKSQLAVALVERDNMQEQVDAMSARLAQMEKGEK